MGSYCDRGEFKELVGVDAGSLQSRLIWPSLRQLKHTNFLLGDRGDVFGEGNLLHSLL